MEQTPEIRSTQKCKCGVKADFIKDYWVAEACVRKEKTYDNTIVADLENTCGIIRRRYCKACLGKIAAQRKRYDAKLNLILFISLFIPFAMLFGKALFDFLTAPVEPPASIVPTVAFGAAFVAITVAMLIYIINNQSKLGKVAKGNCDNTKTVEAIIDSLNDNLDDWKLVKEIPATDIVVDGDGRVNYEMERSGFGMKVMIEGTIAIEAVRSRFRFPIKDEFQHIKRAYLNAELIGDNLRSVDETKVREQDFDIKDGVLRRYSGLAVEIEIPEGVTEIAATAFKGAKNCEIIKLPESVTTIGAEAFSGCPVQVINLPSCVTKIEKFAFYRTSVREIVIPEGVTEIGENCFCDCYELESVKIPASCKRIGEYAFMNCINLVSLEIAEGVEGIGDYAFHGCKSLVQLNIPDGVCEIGNFAFEECMSLAILYLPDTVQFMGGRAFDGNLNLTIYGKEGSYAQQYANETRKRFEVIVDRSALPKRSHTKARRSAD